MGKPIVTAEVMQGRKWVKFAMLRTIHKKPVSDELSDDTFSRLLMAGHSPIRQWRVAINLDMLEDRVHTHMVRHRGADYSVGSFRADWLKELNLDPRDFQDSDGNWLRNMTIFVNAEVLIHMAKQRLCTCAWVDTRVAMDLICDEISKVDTIVASYLRKPCVWFGFCPETKKYCGYMDTVKYVFERGKLVEESLRLRKSN